MMPTLSNLLDAVPQCRKIVFVYSEGTRQSAVHVACCAQMVYDYLSNVWWCPSCHHETRPDEVKA